VTPPSTALSMTITPRPVFENDLGQIGLTAHIVSNEALQDVQVDSELLQSICGGTIELGTPDPPPGGPATHANQIDAQVTIDYTATVTISSTNYCYAPVVATISAQLTSAPFTQVQASVRIIPSLTIETSSLPAAELGEPYHSTLSASGGLHPYHWSITSGSLPHGLSFSDGVFTGTPTVTGTFHFVVTLTDSATPEHTTTAHLSITVS